MVTVVMILKTLAPWKKAMTNIDSILKSRDKTADKGLDCQSYSFFPVVMYRYESWTVKKAEW